MQTSRVNVEKVGETEIELTDVKGRHIYLCERFVTTPAPGNASN